MKSKEELTQLKVEYETLSNKMKELSDDEITEVTGGSFEDFWEKLKRYGEKVKKEIPNPQTTPIHPITPETLDK